MGLVRDGVRDRDSSSVYTLLVENRTDILSTSSKWKAAQGYI